MTHNPELKKKSAGWFGWSQPFHPHVWLVIIGYVILAAVGMAGLEGYKLIDENSQLAASTPRGVSKSQSKRSMEGKVRDGAVVGNSIYLAVSAFVQGSQGYEARTFEGRTASAFFSFSMLLFISTYTALSPRLSRKGSRFVVAPRGRVAAASRPRRRRGPVASTDLDETVFDHFLRRRRGSERPV